MKQVKYKLILIALILSGGFMSAQNIELIPSAGYTFRNRIPITGGEVEFKDGATYGAALRFHVRQDNYVEIFYSYQETFITGSSIYFTEPYRSEGSFNYILIGSTQKVPLQDMIEAYGGRKTGCRLVECR